MNSVFTIFRKEVGSFFNSLIGYVFLGVFLVSTGLFVWVFEYNILETRRAELDSLFFIGPYLFLFMVPAITMRAFSEEKKQGTMELLATKPLTHWQIIGGKYLAAVFLVLVTLLPTLVYLLTVWRLGQPVGNLDLGATIGAYLGLFFLGAVFASIGLFASVLVEEQFVAWVLGAFICFAFFFAFELLAGLPGLRAINPFLIKLGLMEHYASISRGVIDTRDALYFLSVITMALFSTHYLLTREQKR